MSRSIDVALAVLMATGVAPAGAAERGAKDRADPTAAFTLGVVQKELRKGLFQAEVAERLGAPNILMRDGEGREAWVYDRVFSEVEVSSGSVGIGGVGSGVGSHVAGVLGISAGKRSDKARSSQRTLTVVIRFSAAGIVESFSWHDSRF